jgi:hypothetical protein
MTTILNFSPTELRIRGMIRVQIAEGEDQVSVVYPCEMSPAPVPIPSPLSKVNALHADPPFVAACSHDSSGFTLQLSGKTLSPAVVHVLLV